MAVALERVFADVPVGTDQRAWRGQIELISPFGTDDLRQSVDSAAAQELAKAIDAIVILPGYRRDALLEDGALRPSFIVRKFETVIGWRARGDVDNIDPDRLSRRIVTT